MEYAGLVLRFAELYSPTGEVRTARAPGLVKLLGEHTECSGLPVLAMTIADDAKVAFAPRQDSTIRLARFGAREPEVEFSNAANVSVSAEDVWENPCKVAVQALNAHFKPTAFPGMDVLCDATILADSGLDWAPTMTVACAMAYLRVLGRKLGNDLSRIELANLLSRNDPNAACADFAAILAAQPDAACKVDVFPVRVESVPVLEGHALVTCNSLADLSEGGEALVRRKAGPVLCRLIGEMVARKAQEEFGDEIALDRLGDLWHGHLCLTDNEVKDLCDRTFPRETTTLEEAMRVLGASPKEIRERWLEGLPEPDGGFPLKARLRHQISEYRRVELARDALLADDPSEFGRLLTASHESCLRDYFLGCPELESLVRIAGEAGALGARLTGDGFGGCTVNLVPEDRLEEFVQTVEDTFFAPKRHHGGDVPDSRILVVEPGAAAEYVDK